jgi:cysteine desulfurase
MDRVYLDNAATTPVAPAVAEAMMSVLTQHYGNPSSIHAEGRTVRALLENARKTVARCIGAGTADVFFTSGGTEANNTAIKRAVQDLGVRRIISSPTEHHCGLHSFSRVEAEHDTEIVLLPVDRLGRVQLPDLERALAESAGIPTLVSLMHANNEIGTMIDLDAVSRLCREHGAYLHTDTVQTIGHFPINVQNTRVSFLSGAAHKFHGPKGIGFLYINPEIRIQPLIDGGSQERNMRGGTENVMGIVGLGKALELATEHMEEHMAHIRGLRDYMREQLSTHLEGVECLGDIDGLSLYTVLNVSFPPHERNELLLMRLDIAGISASGGSACSSGAERGSHVMEAIGAGADRKSIRFSFSRYNTRADIDHVIHQLKAIMQSAEAVSAR